MSTKTVRSLGFVLLILLMLLYLSSKSVSVTSEMEEPTASTETTRTDDGPQHDGQRLIVVIGTDRIAYRLGESVNLRVSVVNVGSEPVWLYSYLVWGSSASLTLRVENAAGTELQPEGLDDSLTPPPPPNDKSLFVKINPHHFFGISRELRLDELNIRKQGKYRLMVKYHSPIPEKFGQGLPIWSREKDEIQSKPLEISVLSRRQ